MLKTNPTPFSTQVLTGQPIIIINPYGNSSIEVLNTLIGSLRRAQVTLPIYTDAIYPLEEENVTVYDKGSGIILMTAVRDNIPYDLNIIPIYIVSWGVRYHDIKQYQNWVAHHWDNVLIIKIHETFKRTSPTINIYLETMPVVPDQSDTLNVIYPEFALYLPDKLISDGGWITSDVLENLQIYSPKFEVLRNNIKARCVIFCPYVEKNGLDLIEVILKELGIPIYLYNNDPANITLFNRNRFSIFLTDKIEPLSKIDPEIPIHIVSLDSDNGMSLFREPHYHTTLNIYLIINKAKATVDMVQYHMLSSGIDDSNRIFEFLLDKSHELIIDEYNNLYI